MARALREHALAIVNSDDLATKLEPPKGPLDDSAPGEALRIDAPARPAALRIVRASEARVPPLAAMPDPSARARIVHALANHELQAAELFAWALLAFPGAPAAFRRGLAAILADEQRHTRMYVARLEALGHRFGDFAVSGYFWSKTDEWTTPLRFCCAMGLTFENANLDHTLVTADAARAAGDPELARVLETVHADEIRHVRFGYTWLERMKDSGESAWDAYRAGVAWPLRPELARGPRFHAAPRRAAGLDEDFVRALESWDEDPRPSAKTAPESKPAPESKSKSTRR